MVAHVINHMLTLWPVSSGIESLWKIISEHVALLDVSLDNPFRVDNGTEERLDFLEGSAIELGIDTSFPGGFWVAVDGLDVLSELEWLLFEEEFHDGWVLAESHLDAGGFWLVEVDNLWVVGVLVDALLQLGEESVDVIDHLVVVVTSLGDDLLAHSADEVVLCEVVVNFSGLSNGNKASSDCEFHLNVKLIIITKRFLFNTALASIFSTLIGCHKNQ